MTEPNPFHTLREMAAGYFVPRCLHVVADLAVADVLDETPRTAADLAAAVGAHPDALGRVLRLLAAYGVFESQDDKFRHSPASRLLRTARSSSWARDTIDAASSPAANVVSISENPPSRGSSLKRFGAAGPP